MSSLLYPAVLFISGALFSFEFLVTRIFSYLVWYHYVFIIISTAVLGLGIGGLWVYSKATDSPTARTSYRNASHRDTGQTRAVGSWQNGEPSLHKLGWFLLGSYLFNVAVFYWNPFSSAPVVYMVLAIVPFIFGGAIMSAIFARNAGRSHVLYFLDLGGTAIFALISVSVLDRMGMVASLVWLLAVMSLATILLSVGDGARASAVIAGLLAIAAVSAMSMDLSWLETRFGQPLSMEKMQVYGVTRDRGTIEMTRWDSLSRTDVVEVGDPAKKAVFMDAASMSHLYRFDGNLETVSQLKKTPGFLPFALYKEPKTLLIGPGGGRDILMALLAGSKDITAVEINKSAIKAVRAFGEYSGNIYDRPEVRVVAGDGRSFIENSDEKYDIIFLPLVMTQAAGAEGLGLSENYIFTKQAFKQYLRHLTGDGQLVFLAHDQDDMTRIVTTALSVLEDTGIPYQEAIMRIAVVSTAVVREVAQGAEVGGYVHYPVIIIRNSPFPGSDAQKILDQSKSSGLVPVYIPGTYQSDVLPLDTYSGIGEIIRNSHVDVTPTTDDRPFFYNFEPGAPTMVYLMAGLVILVGAKLFWPRYCRLGAREKAFAKYFLLIGIGYMAVEVPLIQKNTLIAGHPTTSFLLTVPALLGGSGLGSIVAGRAEPGHDFNLFSTLRTMLPAAILVLGALYWFVVPAYMAAGSALRYGFIVLTALALGMVMGTFFPRGLDRLQKSTRPATIPLMWGINGLASVLGSTLSMAVAMTWGFTWAFVLGAAAYYLAVKVQI